MDSSREIDLVVKLSVLLWNDDMGSDQFKEVVHDQLRDDFMADILRLLNGNTEDRQCISPNGTTFRSPSAARKAD